MLKRIRITGYKSLSGVDVSIRKLSVIFGSNASGKSNFLDALQLLSRIATSQTLKDAFEPPYRGKPLESFTFEQEGIRGLLQKESVSFTFEADVELSSSVVATVNRQIQEMKSAKPAVSLETTDGNGGPIALIRETSLRYRITVEILPKSGILRVADEYLVALNRKSEPRGGRRPFLEQMDGRLHLRMEGQAHPRFYERNLDRSILSMPLYPPHYPHLVAMRQELASWLFFYFEPRERMRAPNPVKEVRHIGLMGEDLAAFLNTLKALEPFQFKSIEKSLQMIVPSVTGLEVDVNSLGEVELRLLEGETPIPARVVSEGTLRVLGLLALQGAKDLPALIGFEEPENGIHPRRIKLIADLLKMQANARDTQIIATTHSPIIPDMIPNESLFVCRRAGGKTVIEPFSTWGPLGKEMDIDKFLNAESDLPVSARILRGDFDA